jgi:RNA polymerase sigma-70 factor, ECF subfamily
MRACYAVALAVVGRQADAEDVAQDAVLLALERVDSCREPEKFVAWLLQIVRNQARNALDRRKLRDVPANDVSAEQGAESSGSDDVLARGRLLAALSSLTPVRREIVLLHDLEGWTHPEISEALGMSELSSRQHLFQARRELRERLGDEAPAREVVHER